MFLIQFKYNENINLFDMHPNLSQVILDNY
jgi:hypothetical protein